MPFQTKREDPRVVIAVPLAGPFIYWKTVSAILDLEKPSGTDLMVFQGALIDRARNHLVEQMLDHPSDPTHIFFLDSDIVLPPDGLVRLLEARAPIVSGLYRRRLPPYEFIAFRGRHNKLRPIPFPRRGRSLQEADTVGAGCLLIEREVFQKMRSPWFASEWRKEGHLSEDFSFCEKARRAGYKILVETGVRPLHLEPLGVGTDDRGGLFFFTGVAKERRRRRRSGRRP